MTDTIVVFPHCAWKSFPYGGLIERLGRGRSVLFVTSAQAMAGAPPQYGTITMDALDTLPWAASTAVVTHPNWVYEIAGRKPAALIALLPPELENGEAGFNQCRDALCASATVVVAGSEPFYFEQWFRRGRVFLLDGIDTAADLLTDAAISDAAAGRSVDALAKLQLQRRADFRKETLGTLRPSAMQFFFQAVYHYLLGNGEDAERWALDAFHLAILTAEEGAVQTYFRFLSAIRLMQKRPEDAIATFGISVVSEEERSACDEMSALQAAGETQLAAALVYRMNDDFRQAAALLTKVLEKVSGEEQSSETPLTEVRDARGLGAAGQGFTTAVSDDAAHRHGPPDAHSDAARHIQGPLNASLEAAAHRHGPPSGDRSPLVRAATLLIEAHERSGRPAAALALLAPSRTVKERLRRNLLEGRAFAMEGRRHDAVRALLQAAMTGLEPLHVIAEIASVHAKAKRMAEGDYS